MINVIVLKDKLCPFSFNQRGFFIVSSQKSSIAKAFDTKSVKIFAGIMSPPLDNSLMQQSSVFSSLFLRVHLSGAHLSVHMIFSLTTIFYCVGRRPIQQQWMPLACLLSVAYSFQCPFFAESRSAFRPSVSLSLTIDGAMSLLQKLMSAFKTCVKYIILSDVSTSLNPTRKKAVPAHLTIARKAPFKSIHH